MSVNKPTNITPPGKAPRSDAKKRPSLFERASGAFGLDRLNPAAVPDKLERDKTRKFASSPKPTLAQVAVPLGQHGVGELPIVAGAAAAPTPSRPPEPSHPLVQFSGQRHEIVRSLLREQGLIDPDHGSSTLLEEFRIIKRQLIAAAQTQGKPAGRRVLVCSPHPNEGKTFCALNLAIAMAAERDSEVVLIDADFAKPSIMTRLGLPAGKGFMDALKDKSARIEDYVVGTDIPGLWVLPAGERTGADSEYLASGRTAEVLDRLTLGAPNRMLVFDSPPALAASPAAELAKHVGQALLVARADQTGQAALEDAVDLLSACPDVKLLLNDATFSPSGRKFGSYYGYGE